MHLQPAAFWWVLSSKCCSLQHLPGLPSIPGHLISLPAQTGGSLSLLRISRSKESKPKPLLLGWVYVQPRVTARKKNAQHVDKYNWLLLWILWLPGPLCPVSMRQRH